MDNKKNKKSREEEFICAYEDVINGSFKETDWKIIFDNLCKYQAEEENGFKFNLLSSTNGKLPLEILKLDVNNLNTNIDYALIEESIVGDSDNFIMELMKSSGNLEKNLFLNGSYEDSTHKNLSRIASENDFNIISLSTLNSELFGRVEFDENIEKRNKYAEDFFSQTGGGIIYDNLLNFTSYDFNKNNNFNVETYSQLFSKNPNLFHHNKYSLPVEEEYLNKLNLEKGLYLIDRTKINEIFFKIIDKKSKLSFLDKNKPDIDKLIYVVE